MNNSILNTIKQEIKANKLQLSKLAEIDKKYNLNDFNFDKYIGLIDKCKANNVITDKNIGILYFGNVEFTICVCIYAIMNNIKLTLFIQDYFVRIKQRISFDI